MRILVGITSRSWGGNEKWAADAALGLAERGHHVAVFWTYPAVERELERRGLPGRRIRLWGDLNPIGLSSLVRLLVRERPDALVLTKRREYWMGGLAAKIAVRPAVVLRLGLRRPLRDSLKDRVTFGKLADLVIVNSRSVREVLLASPWVDPAKVRVLLNGVAVRPGPSGSGRRLLSELGLPIGAPVVVGAGRLTRQKGFDMLIGAFARVACEVPGAHLVILGGGGQRVALEREAAGSPARQFIHFAGHRDDVPAILSEADVYALSSRNEGMANTLLEAMAVGAPIVATDVSGTREAVTDGVEALVVPPEDPDALAGAIVRLLTDRSLAAAMGAAARRRAASSFSQDRMLDQLEALLAGAVERNKGRKTPGGGVGWNQETHA